MRWTSLSQWVAWHLPRSIVYWAGIRIVAYATGPKWPTTVVPEITASDALKRWER